jgi:predicted DNA-binding transcriptional regulator AlpA
MSNNFDAVRVVNEAKAVELCGVSLRTWKRLQALGETPPKTRLSANRVGYRIADLIAWLDARRIGEAPKSAA